MKTIGREIQNYVNQMASTSEEARVNMRIQQVRERYKKVIESVYRDSASIHLAHTNNVIIKKNKGGSKSLVVFVDESLFAAELNAQRELIKLKLLELFGEEIDDFKIQVSKWKKYRSMHPYLQEKDSREAQEAFSIPLDEEEKSYVNSVAATIDDEKVRTSLEKAMTADMEWKKGKSAKNLV